MPIARSTIAGAVTGVLLLGGAVGFAVGLPKVSEDPGAAASAGDLPKLPDRLDDRMVALSKITAKDAGTTNPEDIKAIEQIANAASDGDSKATSNLGSIYGPSEVRAYIDVKAMAQATAQSAPAQIAVTVTGGPTGLVIPNGPFEISQNGGGHYELREVGGHRCAVAWQQPTDPTTGMPVEGDIPPGSYQTECRAERGGLTYDVYASGLTPDEIAHYLDLVLEKTGADA
ncbi:hypothetical protein [Pimelobacter simplex]|uniref:hypothetical protein n=1 Tax=Nocardioides simplex TaxID=2045 RepID=UPI003AACA390